VRAARRAIAACLLPLAAGTGCLGEGGPRGSALEGGSGSVALGPASAVLDPALARGGEGGTPLAFVYTPPLTYRRAEGEDGTQLIPGVAAELPQVSGDGLTYAFRVRRGLRFSDGSRVDAGDVEHTLRRARALGSTGRRLFRGVSAIAANPRTGRVRVALRRPDPAFAHALAAVQAGVVPARTPLRGSAGRPPPGAGPYRIAGAGSGGYSLARVRDWSLPGVPRGRLDQIAVRAPARAGGPGAQADAVLAGRLDATTTAPPAGRLPLLRSESSDLYSERPAPATDFVAVRARGALADPALREAVAVAIDKPEAARRLSGLIRPTCNVLPPDLPGYDPPDPCPWGDPAEHPDLLHARNLVERAGELGTRVTVASGPALRPVARLYVETLGKIGLRAAPARGRAADLWLLTARAPVPDPGALLLPVARRVPLDVDAPALLAADDLRAADEPAERARAAERLDARLVSGGVVIPYANPVRTLLVSERIDSDNCLRVHPVLGLDLASLCVR
jgi:peptide/nickel transport system substrate-binding protein